MKKIPITLNRPIYFYCFENSFSHLMICLAEGLKELGIPFYSNINYWKIHPNSEETLFSHDPNVNPDDCSIVVMDKSWFYNNSCLPDLITNPNRKFIFVYFDDSDCRSFSTHHYNLFDLVFGTHCNHHNSKLDKLVPWYFGISNRILAETYHIPEWSTRRKKLIVNFRVEQQRVISYNLLVKIDGGYLVAKEAILTFDYPLRPIFKEQFLPGINTILPVDDSIDDFEKPSPDSYHYLQWIQTDRRHYPEYYQRLKSTAACACVGGYIVSNPNTGENRVEWWDSWRFWECLVAGCVALHVDFEKYGVNLPVMPENWRHYIGIDLDNPQEAFDRIANEPEILERISLEGRQWAIDNYSPVPTALRFLETITAYQNQKESYFEVLNSSLTNQITLPLREINLIIFPDWSQPEEILYAELANVIQMLASHPDRSQITLLIDNSNIVDEDADLAVSSVIMNLMMEAEFEVDESVEIALIGKLSQIQWEALLTHINGLIRLEHENQEAIASLGASIIPAYDLEKNNT